MSFVIGGSLSKSDNIILYKNKFRKQDQILFPKPNLTFISESYSLTGPTIFNIIPNGTKNSKSKCIFSHKLKCRLLTQENLEYLISIQRNIIYYILSYCV